MIRSLLVAALLVFPLAGRAEAEEPCAATPCRIKTPSTLKTDGGSELRLPAGVYVVSAVQWAALDAETRRLQEQETRLAAENASLKNDGPGLGTLGLIAAAFAAGVAAAALF